MENVIPTIFPGGVNRHWQKSSFPNILIFDDLYSFQYASMKIEEDDENFLNIQSAKIFLSTILTPDSTRDAW